MKERMDGKDFKFLYWDDPEEQPKKPSENTDDELREEYRMWVIMRNGNSGEHYDIYDDTEEDPDQ